MAIEWSRAVAVVVVAAARYKWMEEHSRVGMVQVLFALMHVAGDVELPRRLGSRQGVGRAEGVFNGAASRRAGPAASFANPHQNLPSINSWS